MACDSVVDLHNRRRSLLLTTLQLTDVNTMQGMTWKKINSNADWEEYHRKRYFSSILCKYINTYNRCLSYEKGPVYQSELYKLEASGNWTDGHRQWRTEVRMIK